MILDAIQIEQLYRVAGLLGFFFYMASFAALQFRMIDGQGLMYSSMNVLAAFLVLVSLIGEFNLASALIQISWIVIGLTGIMLRLRRRRPFVLQNKHRHISQSGFAST